MPNEDLTTYTELDPNADLTVTAATVTVSTKSALDPDARVHKDFGVDYFNALDVDFDFVISTLTDAGAAAGLMVGNTLDDHSAFVSPDIGMWINRETSGYRIGLSRGAMVAYTLSGYILTAGTTYYGTVDRATDSDTARLYVYTDAARTAQIAGSPFAVAGYGTATKWRYLFAWNEWRQAVAHLWDGSISNVNLNLAGGASGFMTLNKWWG